MPKISTSIAELLLQKFSKVEEWMKRGNCAQGDMEWDPMYQPEADYMASEICGDCPVIEQCEQYVEEIMDSQDEGSSRTIMGVYAGVNHFRKDQK